MRRGVVEQGERLLEVAGHRPGHDGGVPLGDEQAEQPALAEHAGDGAQRGGGVGHHLEHAVAEHHVGSPGDVEVGEVALDAGDQVGDAGLVGAPAERRERVRTRVDDGDGVPLLGQPDREPAGAAADVDDGRGPLRLEAGRDGVPDHAGPDAAPALAGRHGAQPRGSARAGHPGLPGLRCQSLRATSLTDSPAGLTSA